MGGGGKGGDAPDAPNYSQLAKDQAVIDRKNADLLTSMNRPTQNNPFGQVSWKQNNVYTPEEQARRTELEQKLAGVKAGSDDAKRYQAKLDEITGKVSWEQNETWDPRIMAGYDQALGLKDKAMGELANQGPFQGPDAVEWDPNSGKAASDAMYQSYMSRAGQQQARDTESLTTKLRQQGLQPGTEAFDRAMRNQLTAHGDINAKANLDSIVLGGSEARQNYASQLAGQNQAYAQADKNYSRGWDTAGAANNMLNSQYRPTFTGFSGATGYNPADMMGASQAQYQAKMGQYSAGQQGKGNLLGAAGSLGGGYLGGK